MKQILFRADGQQSAAATPGLVEGIINAAGNAALKTGQGIGAAASAFNTHTTNTTTASYSETSDGGRGTRIALIAGGSLVALTAVVLLIVKSR